MLTPDERTNEAKITKEEEKKPGTASSKWRLVAEDYKRKGGDDCCYFCEAGRAYMRAAADFARDGLAKDADEATQNAALCYKLCGDMCTEIGDFLCASTGFAQASLIFRRLAKNYQAAGAPAEKVKAMNELADQAEKGVQKVDELERMTDY